MSAQPAKRILIAPLDWGLGHTTRCVPIIRHLLALGHEVVFAGEQWQQDYILGLFPDLLICDLAGYRVRYSAAGFMYAVMRQIPRILRLIRREHDWLLTVTKDKEIDGIISDNRYGLWHPTIPSIILTHQLQVISGIGQWADNSLRRLHSRYLNRFSSCWIVDVPAAPGLGGTLSHPGRRPVRSRYIGWLSQLDPPRVATQGEHLLILLSGPEPQRSILSDLLWKDVCRMDKAVVFIEGSASATKDHIPPHIQYHSRINARDLQPLIETATMVVCRSGYSSLMDLVLMKKPAMLIPTPGQTEQEYLAKSLSREGIYYSSPQQGFSLTKALLSASSFPFKPLTVPGGHEAFKPALAEWLEGL